MGLCCVISVPRTDLAVPPQLFEQSPTRLILPPCSPTCLILPPFPLQANRRGGIRQHHHEPHLFNQEPQNTHGVEELFAHKSLSRQALFQSSFLSITPSLAPWKDWMPMKVRVTAAQLCLEPHLQASDHQHLLVPAGEKLEDTVTSSISPSASL